MNNTFFLILIVPLLLYNYRKKNAQKDIEEDIEEDKIKEEENENNEDIIIDQSSIEWYDSYKYNQKGDEIIGKCLNDIIKGDCEDDEKRKIINRKCGSFSIFLNNRRVNVRCDEETLTKTISCMKKKFNGYCSSQLGKEYMDGIGCNQEMINIKCSETPPNNIFIKKLQTLEEELKKEIDETNQNKECECTFFILVKKYYQILFLCSIILFIFILFRWKSKRKK